MPATYIPGPHGPIVVASGASGAFTPASLSGLVAYWDADVGVSLSGSSVLTWTDQSPNAYVLGLNNAGGGEANPTSPTFGASSFNSKAGLTFAAASGNYLATSAGVALSGTSLSVFMAASMTINSGNFARLISVAASVDSNDFAGGNSVCAIIRASTLQSVEYYYNGANGSYSITYSTPSRFGVVFDNTNATTYLNNAQQAQVSQALTFANSSSISVGDGKSSGGAFFDGVIRRIVVTKSIVSSTDRANIDTWLQG